MKLLLIFALSTSAFALGGTPLHGTWEMQNISCGSKRLLSQQDQTLVDKLISNANIILEGTDSYKERFNWDGTIKEEKGSFEIEGRRMKVYKNGQIVKTANFKRLRLNGNDYLELIFNISERDRFCISGDTQIEYYKRI